MYKFLPIMILMVFWFGLKYVWD